FQPELMTLAQKLSVRTVNAFHRFLLYVRPDAGAQNITPDKEIYDWKRAQEEFRDHNPLSLAVNGKSISLVSKPRQERCNSTISRIDRNADAQGVAIFR